MEYSPTLAVATVAFEIVAAAWVFAWRPRRETSGSCEERPGTRTIARTAGTVMLLLAGYQLAEVATFAEIAAWILLDRSSAIARRGWTERHESSKERST